MLPGPGPLDPLRLTNSFNPPGEPYVLAARLHGQLKTAFPDGRPQAPATEGAAEGAAPAADDAEKAEPPKAEHLTESSGEANIIVVADVDMLADGLWVRVQDFFGQRVAMPGANNGAFVVNPRSEERRVGKEVGSQGRSRWATYA